MTLPIRWRLTCWYLGVLATVLVAFSAGVLWLQGRFGRLQFDSELASVTTTSASVLRSRLAESHDLTRAAAATRAAIDIPNRTVAILDDAGRPIAARWRGFDRRQLPRLGDSTLMTATLVRENASWRVRLQREESSAGAFIILVAGSEAPLTREQHLLERTLLVGTPAALLFSALVCWWAASRALRPVTLMSEAADRVTLQSLDIRLSTSPTADEVGRLGRAFNRLLDRVAAAVATQRQFMADASHELRTPISAARTAADVMLAQPHRDEDEYRDALSVIVAQTTRLGRMVDDMLVLARADVGGYRLRVTGCRLDEILEDAARTSRVLASIRKVTLDVVVEAEVRMPGDEALLRQMTLNLLDNAVKHTPAGGRVRLCLRTRNGTAEIAVSDTGWGIPVEDRERVFERFVRLDTARDTSGGAGLGLPIARWIAESHRGTLALLASGPSGSTFVVRLPLGDANGDVNAPASTRTWDSYIVRVAGSKPTAASDPT
jgi:heavy metal sensor kinase